MYTLFYKALILQGEIWYWSLLRLKGLRVLFQAGLSLTVGSRWYPSAVISEYNCQVLLQKKKERKQDQKNFQAVHFAASYLPGNFIKILVIALLKGVQVAEHSCIQSFMLPWKLRKNQILPVTQNLSSVYFSLAKFQLVSWNLSLAMIWQMKYTHKLPKLCSATLKHPHSQNREFNLINKNREEKSLRHVTMVAKLLDLNKAWSCKYGRKKKNKTKTKQFSMHDFCVWLHSGTKW